MNFSKLIESNAVVKIVSDIAIENQVKTYIVGGYVRDIILGKQSKDIDFVIDGDGIDFAQKVVKKLIPMPSISVFKNFETAHFIYKETEYEFVSARKESYLPHSRNPEVRRATIEEDQKRRDFTMNALSISLNQEDYGVLHDPFGGVEHIQKGIIKTPVEPGVTFFDDPLRMLRAVRFASQLHFSITDDCFRAIKEQKNRISIITSERISEEINKILMTSTPSVGLHLMEKSGLMEIILPELSAMKGVDKIERYAHKDVFNHTLEVLDNISKKTDNLWLRWAALLHDVGKPRTKKFVQNQGWTFHSHEIVGSRIVRQIFKRLKLPLNDKLDYVQKIVGLHLRPIALVEDDVTDSAIRRLLFDAGNDIDDLMLLCEADITSKNEQKIVTYLKNFVRVREKMVEVEEKDKLRNWQPPISGEMIMETFDILPSKEVGIIKNAIREAILDGVIANNFDEAFEFMITFAKKIQLEKKT
jgi:poly(A) polymerase